MFKKIGFLPLDTSYYGSRLRVFPYENERVPVIGGYSEVMMHFGLAGKPIEVALLRQTRGYSNGPNLPAGFMITWMCQVYKDGKPFSAPILCSEGGFYCEYEADGTPSYYTYPDASRIDPRDLFDPEPKKPAPDYPITIERRFPSEGWVPVGAAQTLQQACDYAKSMYAESQKRVQLRLLDEEGRYISYFDVMLGETYAGTAPIINALGAPLPSRKLSPSQQAFIRLAKRRDDMLGCLSPEQREVLERSGLL
jgi:hypothetical protein